MTTLLSFQSVWPVGQSVFGRSDFAPTAHTCLTKDVDKRQPVDAARMVHTLSGSDLYLWLHSFKSPHRSLPLHRTGRYLIDGSIMENHTTRGPGLVFAVPVLVGLATGVCGVEVRDHGGECVSLLRFHGEHDAIFVDHRVSGRWSDQYGSGTIGDIVPETRCAHSGTSLSGLPQRNDAQGRSIAGQSKSVDERRFH